MFRSVSGIMSRIQKISVSLFLLLSLPLSLVISLSLSRYCISFSMYVSISSSLSEEKSVVSKRKTDRQIYSHDISNRLYKHLCYVTQFAFRFVVRVIKSKPAYSAKKLPKAMKNLATDDNSSCSSLSL